MHYMYGHNGCNFHFFRVPLRHAIFHISPLETQYLNNFILILNVRRRVSFAIIFTFPQRMKRIIIKLIWSHSSSIFTALVSTRFESRINRLIII